MRATRGAGRGTNAIVMRDVQRIWRNPMPLLFWLASMVVPYAVQALGIAAVNPPISALVLMGALIGFFNSLRVLTRTKGLQRCFPFSTAQVRTATMVVPAILALIWAIATMPAFMGVISGTPMDGFDGATTALVTAVAGFLAAVRWVSAKPADYSTPMVAVGVGAMPPGMMFSILRGIDIVALVTLPIVLGGSAWISLVIALIAFSLLRTGFDKEALAAQQEEQKKQLEEMKAQRQGRGPAAQKVKVQRRR